MTGDAARGANTGSPTDFAALLAALAEAGGALPAGRLAGLRAHVAAAAGQGLVTVARGGALVALTAHGHAAAAAERDSHTSDGGGAADVDVRDTAAETVGKGGEGLVAWGPAPQRPLRIAYLDTENVVRPSAKPPAYLQRHTYQLGGVRGGADAAWVAAVPRLSVYVRDDAIMATDLHGDHVEGYAHAAGALDAVEALCDWLDGADVVVAHNGAEVDFPAVEALWANVWRDRHPDEPAPLLLPPDRCVDSLYLTHAVWPQAASHRLGELAAAYADGVGELTVHEAADDAALLARVAEAAAAAAAGWPAPLREVVAACGAASRAWQLLAALGGPQPSAARPSAGEVRAAVAALLPDRPAPPAATVSVDEFRGTDGRVDVARLAAHLTDSPEPRPAQEATAATLHRYARDGGGLVEAPTGTGKTLALLAAALDWLAEHSSNRVVIATYTKALQRQLAGDVDDLVRLLGPLDADLVKGQANRLSLRGLVVAATDLAAGRRGAPREAGAAGQPGGLPAAQPARHHHPAGGGRRSRQGGLAGGGQGGRCGGAGHVVEGAGGVQQVLAQRVDERGDHAHPAASEAGADVRAVSGGRHVLTLVTRVYSKGPNALRCGWCVRGSVSWRGLSAGRSVAAWGVVGWCGGVILAC